MNRFDWCWQEQKDTLRWDHELALLNGHPLQSILWGEARKQAEEIEYRCFVVYQHNKVCALARVELRNVFLLGGIAWIPKVSMPKVDSEQCLKSLARHLKKEGFIFCASDHWVEYQKGVEGFTQKNTRRPKTIWIDLTVGKEQLLQKLDKQWRYGSRKAIREGVIIEQNKDQNTISEFYQLCKKVADAKRFKLPGSQVLIENLLALTKTTDPVEARLFVARFKGNLCAGAFVMRSGKHVHYMWGGVNREYSRLSPGEAVQWAVMEWAVDEGCELYDLEGIDPVNNPGTYKFKKKMGGREVELIGVQMLPLGMRGLLLNGIHKLR